MPRFAANLTMMFNEWSFLDRFAAAADAGFESVEYLFPYDFSPDDIAAVSYTHLDVYKRQVIGGAARH